MPNGNPNTNQPQVPITPDKVNEMMVGLYGRVGGLQDNPRMTEMLQTRLMQAMEIGDESTVKKLLSEFKGLGLSPDDIMQLTNPPRQQGSPGIQGQQGQPDVNQLVAMLQMLGGQ